MPSPFWPCGFLISFLSKPLNGSSNQNQLTILKTIRTGISQAISVFLFQKSTRIPISLTIISNLHNTLHNYHLKSDNLRLKNLLTLSILLIYIYLSRITVKYVIKHTTFNLKVKLLFYLHFYTIKPGFHRTGNLIKPFILKWFKHIL